MKNNFETLITSIQNKCKSLESVFIRGERKKLPQIFDVEVIFSIENVSVQLIPKNPEDIYCANLDELNSILHRNGKIIVALEDLLSLIKTLEGDHLESISHEIKRAKQRVTKNLTDLMSKIY